METLRHLSDEELLARLHACVADERRGKAKTLAILADVEERRLHLVAAYPSMFDFCVVASE